MDRPRVSSAVSHMMISTLLLNLFAEHYQFYFQDDDIQLGYLSDAWTQIAVDRMLAIVPGAVGVSTALKTNVPVIIEVSIAHPEFTWMIGTKSVSAQFGFRLATL